MKKSLLITILFCACTLLVHAQSGKVQQYENQPFDSGIARDFTWGEYDHPTFDMISYPKEPSAHAVVVKEFGKAWITSNGNVSTLMFEYHVKIKLFDEQALKRGHIEIPYYIQDNGSYEEITQASVYGITYYRSPDGAMHSANLNTDSVAIVKKNKHWSAIVFNMPKLSKGCIIEYKYRLESPYLDKFKTWEFQSDIPKMYSEFEAHIPNVFGYNVSLRGTLPLSKDTVSIEKNCFESTELRSDCRVEDYRIDNISAFKPEPYMLSPPNYMSALYFQVTRSTQLNNFVVLDRATQTDVAGDWNEADRTLRYSDNFGSQLNRASVINDKTHQITNGITDTIEKAKAIYAFIQKSIAFDGLYSIYTDNGIKKAFDKHSGNSADINILLIAALRDAGIKTEPVIIATRIKAVVNNLYPAITEFNNVIAAAIINNKVFLLDATDPLLPFGMLPFNDLNIRGRVIPENGPSYWVKPITPQHVINITAADLTFDANGTLKGTINCYAKSYAAYEKRAQLAFYKSSAVLPTIQGLTISGSSNNAADQSTTLTQTYQVQVNNQDKPGNFTFVPFMLGKPVKEPVELLDTLIDNPFNNPTRTYPINFGMPSAYSFTVTIHLPAGYVIDNPPQNVSDSIPGIGGINAIFNADKANATYTLNYNLDNPDYNIADYAKLRSLFDKIVLAEKAAITIKKQ